MNDRQSFSGRVALSSGSKLFRKAVAAVENSHPGEEEEEEEKQNLDNGDNEAEKLIPVEFEQFTKRLEVSTTLRELAQLRNDVLEWARKCKRNGEWDLLLFGPRLHLLLESIREMDDQLQAENMEVIEAPEMTKLLSEDMHQHQCDLYVFFRVLLGWTFVFVLCQVPWLVVIFVFRMENVMDDEVMNMPPNLHSPCQQVSTYLVGFYVIFLCNIFFSLVVASAQAVDNNRNLVIQYSPRIMGFLGFCLIAYNIYGVIVIWNAPLWSDTSQLSPKCFQARNLSVAVLSFFFLLPLLCMLVGTLEQKSSKKRTGASTLGDRALSHGNSSVGASHQQQQQQQDEETQDEEAKPDSNHSLKIYNSSSSSRSPTINRAMASPISAVSTEPNNTLAGSALV
ncbi:hypothetical protein BASA81_001857 [Batrachochytrium salamandrivorans]|nr:hypothetical protein BASA81_001857 [Batrachochytrium salamandrivorans]